MAAILDDIRAAVQLHLKPGWELEVRQGLIHVVHAVHGSIAIPENYAYTPEYRANLQQDFDKRCPPAPDFCSDCGIGRIKVVMGLKEGYEGVHIHNVRVFCLRT